MDHMEVETGGIASETLLTIPEAAREIPPKGVDVATVWRWVLRGTRGRKLESVLIGGRRYTSREALARFSQPAIHQPGSSKPTSRQRERQIAAAEAELAAMGVR